MEATSSTSHRRLGSAILAVMLSIIVAVSLTPVPAHAAVAVGKPTKVATQAAKTKIWVMTKADTTERKEISGFDGLSTTYRPTNRTVKYSYNSNGQLTKLSKDIRTVKFKYKSGRISSYTDTSKGRYHTFTESGKLSYDKKKRISKLTKKSTAEPLAATFSYNSKNRVIKQRQVVTPSNATGSAIRTFKYGYNKAGYLSKMNIKWSPDDTKESMKYSKHDKHNNVTNYVYAQYNGAGKVMGYKRKYSYKLTYEGDKVTKRVETCKSGGDTEINAVVYSYKQMNVPKKYVSQIKRQQWELLNDVGYYPVDLPIVLMP